MAVCFTCHTVCGKWQWTISASAQLREGRQYHHCGLPILHLRAVLVHTVVLIGLTCRHYIALYIEHIPLTTERKALKVLEVCERHQLKEQGELVSNGGGW